METTGSEGHDRPGTALAPLFCMLSTRLEQERPGEWLRRLAEEPDEYKVLLTHTGGLARAAYRVARARCRAQGGPGETPTLRELQAAALMLSEHLGSAESLPIISVLASECEEQGLPVIRPLGSPSEDPCSVPCLRRAG